MPIARIINTIARLYNKVVMALITILLLFLLIRESFDPENFKFSSGSGLTILILWATFAAISLFYTVNGFLLNGTFKKEIKKYKMEGKPLQGVRGFNDLVRGLASARNTSLLITFAAVLSFVLFVATPTLSDQGFEGSLFTTLAVTMALIAVSIVFLIEYPDGTGLDPGDFIAFYEPDAFPMTLDNLLSDVFMTYIDPVTWLKIDDYRKRLGKMLEVSFEADEPYVTRLERAFEKILLIAYLSNSISEVMTDEVIKSELVEMIGTDDYDEFMAGEKTGLTFKEVRIIMEKIEDQAPEPFRLVDRLIINLTDNYEEFTTKDLYFTISALTNQGSIKESSGIIAFFLNNTENKDRVMKVKFRSDRGSIHPEYQEVKVGLDAQSDRYPKEQPKFIADGEDVLSILADILQTGDAVWLRFKPSGFGFKVITVQAEDQTTGSLMGQSLEMKFTKSISWYMSAYLPKLSALGGVALPVIQGLVGFG
ncbi:MAG: hypothetical protein ACXAD7_10985 [Candidatus Kariarchaeaceae archaeon]|jgi:hypothetical protein